MKMKTRLRVFAMFTLVWLLSLWFQGCSAPSISTSSLNDESSTGSNTTSNLRLDASSATVAPGGSVQLYASGGLAPYSYSLTSTLASINTSTGYLTAGTAEGTVTVYVEDAYGETRALTLTIYNSTTSTGGSSALALTYSPASITYGTAVTITPTAGTAPYTYYLLSGSGSLSGNVYTTPSFNETATVYVMDASGATSQISLTTTATGATTTGMVVGLMFVENSTTCPAGLTYSGTVSSTYNYFSACAQYSALSSTGLAVKALSVTSGGLHSSTAICPSGYAAIATFHDCNNGACYGVQTVCAAYTTGSSSAIKQFWITTLGSHVASGPGCSPGSAIGSAVDCAGGYCSGYQQFCVSY
jgi:hypothetical protein